MKKKTNLIIDTDSVNDEAYSFPIIGIGASAGGLDAIQTFFANIPSNNGLAFVIIQHLDPDHKSILADLVKLYTTMNVLQIVQGVEIQKNTVYIIPPGAEVTISNDISHLNLEPKPKGPRLPIDTFFTSLANRMKDKAIGIILSGTGTDGTLGLRAIKAENGVIFVQNPDEAKYNGMPSSAISTGLVDYVFNADKISEELLTCIRYMNDLTGNVPIPEEYNQNFASKIFKLLKARVGHDFSSYKLNTIFRRIERRMRLVHLSRIDEYYNLLLTDQKELEELFNDFLIGVTNFFRDTEAFEYLKENIIPEIISRENDNHSLRIWIPGCSTGEEAYSIAMLFQEFLTDHFLFNFRIQIFATDIDMKSIEKARQAIYSENIEADVPENYLNKYFIKEGNTYQIKKSLRDSIVFAEQSIVKDPPFSKVDFISCRNLLIYLSNEQQEKIISTFHYSLNPNGYLFLGTSESLGKNRELFVSKDKKWKVYQKVNIFSPGRYINDLPSYSPSYNLKNDMRIQQSFDVEKSTMKSLVETAILENFTPVSVLINAKSDIVYLQGRSAPYLEPVQGVANLNILEMAKPEIRVRLSLAINKSFRENQEVLEERVQFKKGNAYQFINIHVIPLEIGVDKGKLYLVAFEDITEKELIHKTNETEFSEKDKQYISSLELELKQTKDYLQSVIKNADTVNEELKAANEELQSSNEELQSTNEELETSKEELQSIKEELITANTEYQHKINELSDINNDVSNLLSSTGIATIFLDLDLKIKKFTPKVNDFFSLIVSDIGRPISSFLTRLNYPDFLKDIDSVINTLNTIEKEIEGDDKDYICRIVPYRTVENIINGVVITFLDITNLKSASRNLEISEARYREIFQNSPDSIILHDLDMNIIDANDKAVEEFGYSKKEFLTKNVVHLYSKDDLQKTLGTHKEIIKDKPMKIEASFIRKDGSEFFAEANPCKYALGGKGIIQIAIRNISEMIENRSRLEYWENLFEHLSSGVVTLGLEDLKILTSNLAFVKMFGFKSSSELQGLSMKSFFSDDQHNSFNKLNSEVIEIGHVELKSVQKRKDGSTFSAYIEMEKVTDNCGNPLFIVANIMQIDNKL